MEKVFSGKNGGIKDGSNRTSTSLIHFDVQMDNIDERRTWKLNKKQLNKSTLYLNNEDCNAAHQSELGM